MSENKNKCNNVIFIRHNLNSDNDGDICRILFEHNLIAYHYDDVSHQDFLEYLENLSENAENCLIKKSEIDKMLKSDMCKIARLFEKACKNEELVVAEYTIATPKGKKGKEYHKHYLLGRVKKQEVKNLDKNGNEIQKGHQGEIYKTLELEVKEFDKQKDFPVNSFPVYYAVRPPFVTYREYGKGKDTCQNPFFEKIIPAIYDNKCFDADVHTLHPSMIEQLCEEYLRLYGYNGKEESQLQYSSCRVGKNMEKHDIVGRAKNNIIIYAQVKADDVSKHHDLYNEMKKEDGKIYIVFADNTEQKEPYFDNTELGIKFISIRTVFNYFKHNRKLLTDMMGLPEKYEKLAEFK